MLKRVSPENRQKKCLDGKVTEDKRELIILTSFQCKITGHIFRNERHLLIIYRTYFKQLKCRLKLQRQIVGEKQF